MIVRVRDAVFALLLFPLAFSGFALGAIIGGMSEGAGLFAVLFLLIPIAYFVFIKLLLKKHPKHLFFGELSAPAFIGLAIGAYVLPLVAGIALIVTYS